MATTRQFFQKPSSAFATIVNADGTTEKVLYTCPSSGDALTYGSRCVSIAISSDDTSARNIQIKHKKSGVSYLLGTIPVAIGAGTGSIPSADGLNLAYLPFLTTDEFGRKVLRMAAGESLVASLDTGAVTAAKTVTIKAALLEP